MPVISLPVLNIPPLSLIQIIIFILEGKYHGKKNVTHTCLHMFLLHSLVPVKKNINND